MVCSYIMLSTQRKILQCTTVLSSWDLGIYSSHQLGVTYAFILEPMVCMSWENMCLAWLIWNQSSESNKATLWEFATTLCLIVLHNSSSVNIWTTGNVVCRNFSYRQTVNKTVVCVRQKDYSVLTDTIHLVVYSILSIWLCKRELELVYTSLHVHQSTTL